MSWTPRPPRSPSPPPRPPKRAKLGPGARKLLDTSRPNPKTASFTQANSTTSSLLKLPSEVRNRIYQYVFGIGILRVGSPDEKYHADLRALPKAICHSDEHEADATKSIRESEDLSVEDFFFTTRHHECFHSLDGSEFWKLLNVLKVCRQIHREAALLPYQLNTFYFNHFYRSFSVFREALAPEQRKEIRGIGLFLYSMVTLNSEELKLYDMTNVRDFSIFVHYACNEVGRVAAWLANDNKDDNDLGCELFNHIQRAGLDLRSVSVTVYPRGYIGATHSAEVFKRWSGYVEKKLLEAEEGKEGNTKKMTRSGNGYGDGGTKRQRLS